MEEVIVNIYMIDSIEYPGLMKEYSMSAFSANGSDEDKLRLLQTRTKTDISMAKKFAVQDRYQMVINEPNKNRTSTIVGYVSMARVQKEANDGDYSFFSDGLKYFNLPDFPLCALSVLVKNTLMHEMTKWQLANYDVAQQLGYFRDDIF